MSFRDIELKPEYRSRLDNVIRDFYNPVLKQAVTYKRAVGFFSSSALLSLTAGIYGLVENGGSIQMIASPRLSPEDIEAINDGIRRRDEVIKEALLRELREPKGKFEEARLNLLSNLIAAGRLDIKIAFLEDDNTVGMFHEKLGLMYDSNGNIIAFSGSMNESANAFTSNYEAIDVFASWTQDADRVYNKQSAFNAMWEDYEPSIKVMDFPDVKEEILHRYRVNDRIDTHFDNESSAEDILPAEESNTPIGPMVPAYVHMRPYQIDAIGEWANRNYVGIFDMATGTGKTYTALAAVSRLFADKHQNLAVIIICPYQHLVEQWKEDFLAFGMKPIVCYSASTQRNWRERLKTAVNSFNLGVQNHFCMVSTNATFSIDYVQDLIARLSGNVVLVVDEAHNFGAENLSQTLLPHIPYRLALSATIDRHGDPEGTQKLYDYFGEKCIEYTLKDAIDNDISLEAKIARTKESYYDALEASQAGWHEGKDDPTAFIKYLLGTIIAAYRDFEERMELVTVSPLDTVRNAVKTRIGKFTKAEIAELVTSMSATSVERHLRTLCAGGEIEKRGGGRSTYYIRKTI